MENRWIQNVIESYIKDTGVDVMLTNDMISGLVDVFYYNWISTDGRYFSLLCPCSQTQILPVERHDVVSGCSLNTMLEHNLRIFNTKSEWNVGKWGREYAKEYNDMLKKTLLDKRQIDTVVCGYTVKGIDLHVQPCLGVTLWYFKTKLECLTIWFGYKITVVTCDDKFGKFIQELGFSEWVEVICNRSNIERIGVFDDN